MRDKHRSTFDVQILYGGIFINLGPGRANLRTFCVFDCGADLKSPSWLGSYFDPELAMLLIFGLRIDAIVRSDAEVLQMVIIM